MGTTETNTKGFDWVLSSDGEADIEVRGPLGIGREDDADICIPDWRVSRKHAALTLNGSDLMVQDLSSANGTLVNGKKISGPTQLNDGDVLGVYAREFRVVKQEVLAELDMLLRSDQFGEFELRGEMILGRDESCDITVPEELVSRRHAKIRSTRSGLVIEDLGSVNGTFVNGRKITGPTKLIAGDHLKFCDKIFHVSRQVDPDATRVAGSVVDPDATYILGQGLVPAAPRSNAASESASVRAGVSKLTAKESDDGEHIQVKDTAEPIRSSAIERQKKHQKHNGLSLVRRLAEGIWVEIKNPEGSSEVFRVYSIDLKSGAFTFAPRSSFGVSKTRLLKKSREDVIRDLGFGEIVILGVKRPKGRFSFGAKKKTPV